MKGITVGELKFYYCVSNAYEGTRSEQMLCVDGDTVWFVKLEKNGSATVEHTEMPAVQRSILLAGWREWRADDAAMFGALIRAMIAAIPRVAA